MSEAIDLAYLEEEEPQDQGFVIKDDQAADWAVRKIAEADKDLERMEAWYQLQLSRAREKHDQAVAFFTAKLAQYMAMVPAKETKTMSRYSLVSGDMVLTKEKQDFESADDNALLRWCHENAPELVRVTEKPAWGDIKKRLRATDGGIADTETGLIVEGVQAVTKPQSFKIRLRGADNE